MVKRIKRVFRGRKGFEELKRMGFTRKISVAPDLKKIPRFVMSSKLILIKSKSKAIRLSKETKTKVFEIPGTGFTLIGKKEKRKGTRLK